MPWTILRPSFRSCQVEPLTCTSCCALPSPHLRAGCQCAAEFAYACCQSPRCRIRICVQAAPVYAAEFCDSPNSRQSILLTRLGQSLVQPMFVSNLRCRFSLQPHKSALTISPTDGMAASTLRPCFGQPAEACPSCTFDTVTASFYF